MNAPPFSNRLGVSLFSALADSALSPAFARPSTISPELASYPHVPLLNCTLQQGMPAVAVFIETAPAVVESAREIVRESNLATRICVAGRNDPLPSSCDTADLLHIDVTVLSDALLSEDGARYAPWLESWQARLSTIGLVLIHGTETAAGGALWKHLSRGKPNLLLPHGAGLGMVAPKTFPDGLRPLLGEPGERLDDRSLARLCARLTQLGLSWSNEALLAQERINLAHAQAAARGERMALAQLRADLRPPPPAHDPRPDPVPAPKVPLRRTYSRLPTQIARDLIRRVMPSAKKPEAAPAPEKKTSPAGALQQNVLFVAGEPETPGALYRCYRNADACEMVGHAAQVIACADVSPEILQWADIIILWRVAFSEHVRILLQLAQEYHAIVVFDADDLVFLPVLASVSIIDGIRTIGASEAETHRLFSNFRATLDRAAACFATTDALAHHMRQIRPLTYTLPNIFDAACLQRSRLAMRRRAYVGDDDVLRIGYASGTRTHQRDFGVVADTLARVLHDYPTVRLVLFREAGNHKPVLLMDEFPCLARVQDQIEWRDLVPLEQLPDEFARFDISIAPLETGNIFCEAKSEIKLLEASLANVPSVVSPTAPYRDCVIDGVTGFLAHTPDDWDRALRSLIDDRTLRTRMARDAYHLSLWNFSPERQAAVFESVIMSLGTQDEEVARATETMLARGRYQARNVPVIPDARILFTHDSLGQADVSVLITSHNYSALIGEALESVRAQTLPLLDLVVVDDASTDDSVAMILAWAERHATRFNRLVVLAANRNAGLGGARNIGVTACETPYFLSLDADNVLLPNACDALLAACGPRTAYVYPLIRQFGDDNPHSKIMGDLPSRPLQLRGENYIDAMALVAKWAWAAAGGYYVQRDAMGWEDFDLWCTLAEMGLHGTHLPQIVAGYRVHGGSMTNRVTERNAHKARVVALIRARHPWLDIHDEAITRV